MAEAPPRPPGRGADDETSVWQRLLNDFHPLKVGERREASVVVLSSPGCGAGGLISRLQGRDPSDHRGGYALQYSFQTVTMDGDDDALGLLHFWHLETPQYSDLLRVVLTPEQLLQTTVLITVDLSAPHSIMTTIEEWCRRVETIVSEVLAAAPHLALALQQKAAQYLTSQQASPDSPQEDGPSKAPARKPGGGLPIVVVGTKADQAEAVVMRDSAAVLWGQIGSKPPAHVLNFIQLHLRKWCLANGATLVYTSLVSNWNTLLLRNYLYHRAFGAPLPKTPTGKSEGVYIPWGSDSLEEMNKLEVDSITNTPMDTPYGLVIRCPAVKQDTAVLGDVHLVEHQVFLAKQLELVPKRDRDAESLRSAGVSITHGGTALRKSSKDIMSPTAGDRVQRDAKDFFAEMDKRYKKP
eukprot:GGOE01036854.1.p1 GENE.GGOE01036854.1~~GGOE01036854.1.p1  ORF type:complete len:429 (-),score=105.31 GGOE01036854.1:179-1408(-)